MVEHSADTCSLANRPRNQLCSGGERRPAVFTQTMLGRRRPAFAVRSGLAAMSSASTTKASGKPASFSSAAVLIAAMTSLVVHSCIGQPDGDECADQRQRSRWCSASRNCAGLGGHEAPVAKFGAFVTGRLHLIEHARCSRSRRRHVLRIPGTPHEHGALAICSSSVVWVIGGAVRLAR